MGDVNAGGGSGGWRCRVHCRLGALDAAGGEDHDDENGCDDEELTDGHELGLCRGREKGCEILWNRLRRSGESPPTNGPRINIERNAGMILVHVSESPPSQSMRSAFAADTGSSSQLASRSGGQGADLRSYQEEPGYSSQRTCRRDEYGDAAVPPEHPPAHAQDRSQRGCRIGQVL